MLGLHLIEHFARVDRAFDVVEPAHHLAQLVGVREAREQAGPAGSGRGDQEGFSVVLSADGGQVGERFLVARWGEGIGDVALDGGRTDLPRLALGDEGRAVLRERGVGPDEALLSALGLAFLDRVDLGSLEALERRVRGRAEASVHRTRREAEREESFLQRAHRFAPLAVADLGERGKGEGGRAARFLNRTLTDQPAPTLRARSRERAESPWTVEPIPTFVSPSSDVRGHRPEAELESRAFGGWNAAGRPSRWRTSHPPPAAAAGAPCAPPSCAGSRRSAPAPR